MNVIGEGLLFSQKTRETPRYRRVIDMGHKLRKQLEELLDDDSILILPCLPDCAPKHNGTFLRMNNCGYTAIFNTMELPVTQCSLGLGKRTRMPIGCQIVAKRLNDRLCLTLAELLAKEFGGWCPPCPVEIQAD